MKKLLLLLCIFVSSCTVQHYLPVDTEEVFHSANDIIRDVRICSYRIQYHETPMLRLDRKSGDLVYARYYGTDYIVFEFPDSLRRDFWNELNDTANVALCQYYLNGKVEVNIR